MAHSGEVLEFGHDVFDKHSTGGVPGNKVTLIIVPIVAAAGLFIPKTSTRAITSPSGTADSMEVLANVSFSQEKLRELLKAHACIAWGGAINMAPADNDLINIERPLNMDPQGLMIASILCKKLAMGVKKLVLDIPCGPGTKFPTLEDGKRFAILFNSVAKRVGIENICALTQATQPIGHFVGPALEAREAMRLLRDFRAGPNSLIQKSVELAGILLEMGGKAPAGNGKQLATEILRDGRAYKAMQQILALQDGNPELDPEDIPVGPYIAEMKATGSGHVSEVKNKFINEIAKIAGCPAAKGAGIEILAKIGALVEEGQVIFRIFAETEQRLADAVAHYNSHPPIILGGMVIEQI
jgi:AMP phosphorylase